MKIKDFKIKKRLGSGNCGVAYLLEDDRVLKITNHNLEAMIANRIMNKNIDNVNYVYDVFTYKSELKKQFPNYYIIQKRLYKLGWKKSLIEGYYSKNEVDIKNLLNDQNFNKYVKENNFNLIAKTSFDDLNLILNFCCCWKNLNFNLDLFSNVENFIKYFRTEKNNKLNKIKEIYLAIQKLKTQYNIDVADCHQDNMMVDEQGKIHLIDILSNNTIHENIKVIDNGYRASKINRSIR